MNRHNAEAAINKIFVSYQVHRDTIDNATAVASIGKIYELYVLSRLIKEMRRRGYIISYSHPSDPLVFKASPGMLKQHDPHFDMRTRQGGGVEYQIFVNIEYTTMGSSSLMQKGQKKDLSAYHEIDIGIFRSGMNGRPLFNDIALAIECKAVSSINKSILRSVIGLRREMSFLSRPQPTVLSGRRRIPADPPSELRLVTTDPRITKYSVSPKAFGIDCRRMVP